MAGRSLRSSVRLAVIVAASALLVSGCQIVSRVMTQGGGPLVGEMAPIIGCATLRLAPDGGGTVSRATLDATMDVIVSRLTALSIANTAVSATSPDLLTVGLPAGDDAAWRAAITRPGSVAFVPLPPESGGDIVEGEPLPEGIDATPLFGNEAIATASVSEDSLGNPAIALTLTPDAATAFDAFAAAHFGERFAIVVDGIVASAPTIRAREFNGEAEISGSFTREEAAGLVAAIGSGILPVTVTEESWTPAVDGICPA